MLRRTAMRSSAAALRGGSVRGVAAARAHTTGAAREKTKLVGYDNFVRSNPMSDRFTIHRFHHVEFYCSDATNTASRFSWGLGMQMVAKSDQSTGNSEYASYALQSNDLMFTFTAPYSRVAEEAGDRKPHPEFSRDDAHAFVSKHGLAVRSVGILVDDATAAYEASVENGGVGVLAPATLHDAATGTEMVMSEVKLYGDVVMRFISPSGDKPYAGSLIPNYAEVDSPELSYGLTRLDHAVGNVPDLLETVDYIKDFSGLHSFAEFTAEDVGTVDSGLNSMVLASNNEMVLLPINEPTHDTPRKSQIQTYLEQNEGSGLQHMALMSADIFETVGQIRERTHVGGFDFMPRPSDAYYRGLPEKMDGDLSDYQLQRIEELGLLADKDDQGILLQIFTKPLGDRPTCFIEIIQRIGCMEVDANGVEFQRGGCGGFGKGNFSELFKSIEDYEKTLEKETESHA